MKRLFGLLLTLACLSCGAIYPELTTGVRAPGSQSDLSPPPPDDLYFIYFEGAVIPARTRDGREWPSGSPTTYAKLKLGETDLVVTPNHPSSRRPSWPNQLYANYRVSDDAELTVELWSADAIADKPLCMLTLHGLSDLRSGSRGEFDCDSGARITLAVEPAHAVLGVGFAYELRGAEGVAVTRVIPLSPAARAGLKEGVHILTIQGKSVVPMDAQQVRSAINAHSRGGVRLDVEFGTGKRQVITLKDGPIYPLLEDKLPLTKN